MAATLAVTVSNGLHPRGIQNAVDTLTNMVEEAHSTARTQNGATVEIAPDANTGRTEITLYSGRPGQTGYGNEIRNQAEVDATLTWGTQTSFAILVAPSGLAAATAYSHGGTAPTSQPPCANTVDVTVAIGSNTQTWSVPCGEARVQY